jgi:hypothetical protein
MPNGYTACSSLVRRQGPAEQPEPALTSRYAVSFKS